MPLISPLFANVTTINYSLEWPHLEKPSNTTFAGPTQIDICRCGGKNIDLEHIYTRYRCPRPTVRFSAPGEELWILQAPLGQVNLLRPANADEIQRNVELGETAEPSAYAGKNLLLLTGPCPRGRYQAYATLQYLRSLPPLARHNVEYLSLLIQPYEEDCSDDQGGRAYIELARYILEEVPAFKTLYLNIWGEESRIGAREFAMLLWRDGVTIVINWDWCGESYEEYTEITSFLQGIETGTVVKRPVVKRPVVKKPVQGDARQGNEAESDEAVRSRTYERRPYHGAESSRGKAKTHAVWKEVSDADDDAGDGEESTEEDEASEYNQDDDDSDNEDEEGTCLADTAILNEEATTPTRETASSEDGWSDALMTPLSPDQKSAISDNGWQVL